MNEKPVLCEQVFLCPQRYCSMAFFLLLITFFGLAWLARYLFPSLGIGSLHEVAAIAAGLAYTLIGISHFAKPEKLEAMLEGITKHKRLANYASGAVEILLGIGMFFPATRLYATIGLIVLMVVVFPANINVARRKPTAYNISRLFFQPVYIVWLLWAGGFIG